VDAAAADEEEEDAGGGRIGEAVKGDNGPPLPRWILALSASMTLLCDNLSCSTSLGDEMEALLRFLFSSDRAAAAEGDVWRN